MFIALWRVALTAIALIEIGVYVDLVLRYIFPN